MRNEWVGVSAIILVATTSPSVWAQSQQRAAAVSDLSVGVDVVHETNIARSDAARAAARGLTKADTRVSPSLQLDLVRPIGNGRASLTGEIGYDFHARNPELDRERIGLRALASQQFAICDVEVEAEISRRQSDLGDIAFLGFDPALQSVRNAETRQRYAANLTCGGPIGIRPAIGGEFIKGRNSNALRDRAEFDSIRYFAGLEYTQPSIGEILVYGSQREVDLVSQPLPGGVDGYRVRDMGLRFKRNIGARWQGEAMIGYSWLDPKNTASRNTSGMIWDVSLSGQVGPQLRLVLQTGREFANSLSSDSNYQQTRPSSLQATYAVNERIQLIGAIQNRRSRYSYSGLNPGVVITNETRWIYSGGVNYRMGRRILLGVNGGYERRNANGGFFDYSNSFIGGSVKFMF